MAAARLGIVGRKAGMTRVFTEDGQSIPVTVIEAQPNPIVQVKTEERDGYAAIQTSFGEQKTQRVTKALTGHYAKASVATGRQLKEFRFENDAALNSALENLSQANTPSEEATTETDEQTASADTENEETTEVAGSDETATESEATATSDTAITTNSNKLTVNLFESGQIVDVTGMSIGKGFAGVVKRHNFRTQDATHGNSLAHRAPGSIGQCQDPGRVFKGKKMAGHMGSVQKTMQNLEVVRVDAERQLILVKGAVPGAKGNPVVVQPAVKKTNKN